MTCRQYCSELWLTVVVLNVLEALQTPPPPSTNAMPLSSSVWILPLSYVFMSDRVYCSELWSAVVVLNVLEPEFGLSLWLNLSPPRPLPPPSTNTTPLVLSISVFNVNAAVSYLWRADGKAFSADTVAFKAAPNLYHRSSWTSHSCHVNDLHCSIWKTGRKKKNNLSTVSTQSADTISPRANPVSALWITHACSHSIHSDNFLLSRSSLTSGEETLAVRLMLRDKNSVRSWATWFTGTWLN